jgi:hypothetical protein
MKSRPVGAELFHANERTDGRTDRERDKQADMTELILQTPLKRNQKVFMILIAAINVVVITITTINTIF